jgi:hypothetical protein
MEGVGLVAVAGLLGWVLVSLYTGSTHLKQWEVTRASDPGTYWLVVVVQLATCGFLLYKILWE